MADETEVVITAPSAPAAPAVDSAGGAVAAALAAGEAAARAEHAENNAQDAQDRVDGLETEHRWTRDEVDGLQRRIADQGETIARLVAAVEDLQEDVEIVANEVIDEPPLVESAPTVEVEEVTPEAASVEEAVAQEAPAVVEPEPRGESKRRGWFSINMVKRR